MAAASSFTDAQKAAFVKQATTEGREAAAKAANVSTTTISAWARAIGIKFSPGGPNAKKKGPKPGKKKRRAVNGKNGHASPPPSEDLSLGGLAAVRRQLQSALASVEAMQSSYRKVFG